MIRLGTLRPLWLRLPGLLRPLRLALAVWSGHFLLRFRLRRYLYRRGSLYGRLHRSRSEERRVGKAGREWLRPLGDVRNGAPAADGYAANAISSHPPAPGR